jgi:hypothetical protein
MTTATYTFAIALIVTMVSYLGVLFVIRSCKRFAVDAAITMVVAAASFVTATGFSVAVWMG